MKETAPNRCLNTNVKKQENPKSLIIGEDYSVPFDNQIPANRLMYCTSEISSF